MRNWDYRYCWLRDAAFTLQALVKTGYTEEAVAWREWLLRAIAGSPDRLQILYGVAGERRVPERELPWLSGLRGVHAGADRQRRGRPAPARRLRRGDGHPVARPPLRPGPQRGRLADPARPDELAGERLAAARRGPLGGPRRRASTSPTPRCSPGWPPTGRCAPSSTRSSTARSTATGRCATRSTPTCAPRATTPTGRRSPSPTARTALDASLLLIPQVGFLPPEDERVRGTLRAVQRDLAVDGMVRRYDTDDDRRRPARRRGRVPRLQLLARRRAGARRPGRRRAAELFERLLALRNDVGLLAEEYDVRAGRQLGNVPQAYSHLALVNSALNLAQVPEPGRAGARRAARRRRRLTPGGGEWCGSGRDVPWTVCAPETSSLDA